MKPAPFGYERTDTLDDALAALADNGGGFTVLAGGQSLVPMLSMRLVRPDKVLDIGGLSDLSYIRQDAGEVRIGALTRHHVIEADPIIGQQVPLLAEAASNIGFLAIRHRGTIGGSVAHADPAAEYPSILVATGATVELRSLQGSRSVPADSFFQGYYSTARQPHELITEITFPDLSGSSVGFSEYSRRVGGFALVLAAVVFQAEADQIVTSRIVLGGVAGKPVRTPAFEEAIVGACVRDDFTKLLSSVEPEWGSTATQDIHASSGYRVHLATVLIHRAIASATRIGAP